MLQIKKTAQRAGREPFRPFPIFIRNYQKFSIKSITKLENVRGV
jgi:hypothetical protein